MDEAWRKRLRPASFQGVNFSVDSHEYSTGRRVVHRQFPQQDRPEVEDLGARAGVYRVRAFLVGGDYMVRRDRLVKVCRQGGFGPAINRRGAVLSHPFLGLLRVVCSRITVRETGGVLGFATVDLEFLETSDPPQTSAAANPALAAADAATDAKDAVGAATEAALVTKNVPEHVRDAIANVLVDVGSALSRLDVFRGIASETSVLGFQLRSLINRASSIATSPALVVVSVRDTIDSIASTAANALDSLFVYETLFGIDSDLDEDLPSSVAQAAAQNGSATVELVRVQALAGAVDSAAQVRWRSLDEALERRDRLLARLSAFELACGSASVCSSLAALRVALSNAVPPPDAQLERIGTFTPPKTIAGLALAYRLYDGGSTLEGRLEDLAQRNRAPRPGLLPGGEQLEVLVP